MKNNVVEISELSRRNLGFVLAACFLANACSLTAPFVDRRREAGASTPETLYIGESKPDKPAICYNIIGTPYADIKKLADEECRKHKTGSYASPVKQTVFTCKLLVPNHFYFNCVGDSGKTPAVNIPALQTTK